MHILFTDGFKKRFSKLPQKIQRRFQKRLELFIKNPVNPILRMHILKGTMTGYRAFSVTGNYRAIFRLIEEDSIKLIDIGTHSQVYE